MPLFESRKSRSSRLFLDVVRQVHTEIDVLTADHPREGISYKASVFGGAVAGNEAVTHCPTLKKAWGTGDDGKAWWLTEVFTLAMASRLYRTMDEQAAHSPEEKRKAREAFVTSLLSLFEDHTPTGVEDFLKLDAQYNYDRDLMLDRSGGSTPFAEVHLVYSRAMAACGRVPGLELGRLTLPTDGFDGLHRQGGRLETSDLSDLLALWEALSEAAREMYGIAKELSQGTG